MIAGTYVIVSAERTIYDPEANMRRTMIARAIAYAAGCHVVMVAGVWEGVPEASLQLRGDMAPKTARLIARLFDQDSWLDVGDGVATLRDAFGATLAVFAQAVAVQPGDDSYSVIGGERIRFAA